MDKRVFPKFSPTWDEERLSADSATRDGFFEPMILAPTRDGPGAVSKDRRVLHAY